MSSGLVYKTPLPVFRRLDNKLLFMWEIRTVFGVKLPNSFYPIQFGIANFHCSCYGVTATKGCAGH